MRHKGTRNGYPTALPDAAADAEKPGGVRFPILVAEDNEFNRELLEYMLARLGTRGGDV